jgi:hypothetical protein
MGTNLRELDLAKKLQPEGTEMYVGSVSDTLRMEEMKCWNRNQNKNSKARRRGRT